VSPLPERLASILDAYDVNGLVLFEPKEHAPVPDPQPIALARVIHEFLDIADPSAPKRVRAFKMRSA
jgi:hypothetical protein